MSMWTAASVEELILAAAETAILLPRADGPRAFGNAMPTPIRDWSNYGQEPSRYVRRAEPAAIDRMMFALDAINALPEGDRLFLHAWCWQKVRRGRFLTEIASRDGVSSKTVRRRAVRLCQQIATRLNQSPSPWPALAVDGVSDIAPEIAPITVASQRHTKHWRDPDHMPVALPIDSPQMQALARRLEKQNRRRRKRSKRA